MSTHTQGKWMAATARSSVVGIPIIALPHGYTIGNAHQPGEAGLADARLMAASPDLLDQLKLAVDHIAALNGVIADLVELGCTVAVFGTKYNDKAARAAIDKATKP